MRCGIPWLLSSFLVLGCSGDSGDDGTTSDSAGTGSTTTSTGSGTSDGSTGSGTTGSSSASASGTTGTSGATDSAGSDTGTGSSDTSASGSGSGSTGGGGGGVMCQSEPFVFPEFDKSCSGDDECFVAIHIVDCCGTTEAWGLSFDEMTAFDAAEATCIQQSPDCDCPPGPTTAEDGKQTYNTALIQVICESGTCTTFLP